MALTFASNVRADSTLGSTSKPIGPLALATSYYWRVRAKNDGMKVWMSGDMGADFSSGELKSMYMTFEPSATQEQVEAAMKCSLWFLQ
jgi:hypothetical protein